MAAPKERQHTRRWCFIIYLIIATAKLTHQSHTNQDETKLFKRLKNADYDDRPPTNDNATVIDVDFYLNGISNVQPAEMDYWIDVYLTLRWVDERLQENGTVNDFIPLPNSFIEKLWTPDIFFAKAKQGKINKITDPNIVLKLNPSNGTLIFAKRIRAQLSCNMDLRYFPFDTQYCRVVMQSFSFMLDLSGRYDLDLLRLKWWSKSYLAADNAEEDIRLSLSVPSLDVDTHYGTEECVLTDITKREFSCLRFHITFYRILGFYIWDIYIPSTLMVIVTWMTFWIDRKIIQGRCTIGAFSMVAISNQLNSVKSTLPVTPQTKAADIWLWACQFYVLIAFLQFGIVNWTGRRDLARERNLKVKLEKEQQQAALALAQEPNNPVKKEDKRRLSPLSSDRTEDKTKERISGSSGGGKEQCDMDRDGVAYLRPVKGRSLESLAVSSNDTIKSKLNTAKFNTVGEAFGRRDWKEVAIRMLKNLTDAFLRGWESFWRTGRAKKFDVISRWIFPGSFIIFAITYWAQYLSWSDYYANTNRSSE